jgi:hypothetical protein
MFGTHISRLGCTAKQTVSELIRLDEFQSRNRGQAIQVGAILLILILTMAWATFQVNYVSENTKETEFEHADQTLRDMQSIQSATIVAASGGTIQSHSLNLGTQNPSNPLLVYPPDPSGTVQTTEDMTVEIENAQAVDDATADYLDGSTLSFPTTGLEYQPQYYEYDAPNLLLDNSILVQSHDDRSTLVSHPQLVDGNQLTILSLIGDFNTASSRAELVQATPLSASERAVLVEDTGSPIVIRFQSELPLEVWESTLEDEVVNGNINSISEDTSTDPSTIVIEMDPGNEYVLNLAKVGWRTGDGPAFGSDSRPDAAFITHVSPKEVSVAERRSATLVAEVGDEFLNEMSGVEVEAETDRSSSSVSPSTQLSREDGQIVFRYTAHNIAEEISNVEGEDDTVTLRIVGESGAQYEIEFDIRVINTG